MFSNLLKWILSQSTIDRTYVFKGDVDKFIHLLYETELRKDKIKFSLTKLDKDEFEITDTSSAGIMLLNSRPIKGITLFGKFQQFDTDTLTIRLKTKIRVEIYLFCAVAIFSLIAMFLNIGTAPFWPFLSPLIAIVWFNWIYMIQFKGLIQKVKVHFGLKLKLPTTASYPASRVSVLR
jgi:hypothetical protein